MTLVYYDSDGTFVFSGIIFPAETASDSGHPGPTERAPHVVRGKLNAALPKSAPESGSVMLLMMRQHLHLIMEFIIRLQNMKIYI